MFVWWRFVEDKVFQSGLCEWEKALKGQKVLLIEGLVIDW